MRAVSEREAYRLEVRALVRRKVRHAMLCKGVPPETVDDTLRWPLGMARSIIGGWPAAPTRRLKRKWARRFVDDFTLDKISDIGAACGVEFSFRVVPVEMKKFRG